MVLPIVGPVRRLIGDDPPSKLYYLDAMCYTQAKPIDRPLPYEAHIVWMLQNESPGGRDAYTRSDPSLTSHPSVNDAKMKAYDRFKDRAYESASIGTTAAEVGQSWKMISSRIGQLLLFGRRLRTGDIPGAFSALGRRPPQGHVVRSTGKSVANAWLEFHFGWSPLVRDIHNALEVLVSPRPIKHKVRAKATFQTLEPGVSAAYRNANPYSYCKVQGTVTTRVVYSGWLTCTNPNSGLATQLGLVNPLAVAWELVPFSFVVDWFANAGQVVGALTDFYGFELEDSCTAITVVREEYGDHNWYGWKEAFRNIEFKRELGISLPKLSWRPPKALSQVRGFTAMALLGQMLKDAPTEQFRPRVMRRRGQLGTRFWAQLD